MLPARILMARIAAIVYFFSSCSSNNNTSKSHLGEIDFTASGKAEAQPAFKKGLLFLHSFEYDDASSYLFFIYNFITYHDPFFNFAVKVRCLFKHFSIIFSHCFFAFVRRV